MATITSGVKAVRHGIELDAFRADEARLVLDEVIQGNCFEVHAAVESFSLLFENPPYDHEIGENRNARMEYLFLEHTYRWLKPGGVLVLVIPDDRLATCAEILAIHFRDKALYRLSEPESVCYKQIVVFGVRRTRREREQLKDWDASRAKAKLLGISRNYEELPTLPDSVTGNSQWRRAAQLNSCSAASHWTLWRTSWRVRRRTGKRTAFYSRRKSERRGGR